ncbi:MAG: class I SAM-dependent methyltransferase [Bacteroidales bacterium]
MALRRDFTKYINYVFDNLFPPVLRDSRLFLFFFLYPFFGRKTRYFAEFKERAPFFSGEELRDYYSRLEDSHLKRPTDLNRKSLSYILNNISGESVLDIACGRGYLVSLLADKYPGKNIYGIDIIAPEISAKPDNLHITCGDIENIDFPDNYFDTVICAHTLEHTQNFDKALRELRRVCRSRLIIVVPRQREYKYTFDLHLHFFPYLSSLKRVIKNPGADYRVIGNDLVCTEINPGLSVFCRAGLPGKILS